mmetsp:Transcript_17383/g.67553  ORF Transcript_17383/g.67553 Transcript_17383/m.67553 type:complete len:231 (+) Transcript_17383:34-726(+)
MDVNVIPDLAVRLSKFEEVLDRWTIAKIMATQEQQQQHTATTTEAKQVFTELTNQHEALLQKAEQIRKQQQMESDQMEQLSLEVEALKVEESRLPAVIDESRKVLDVHLTKKNEKSAIIQENESKKMETYQQAQDKIEEFYAKFLGLSFEEIPSTDGSRGGLRFVFTLINPEAPDARYELSLAVNESYKYDLVACSPPVEGTESLVAELNKTESLHAFAVAMRQKFKATL